MTPQDTVRPTNPRMKALIGSPLKVLDHGFVRVVDYMGTDASVVQAARVSYGEGTKTPSDDRSLIRYLMRHQHSTPFEMCEIKLHVKLPIFVARQWVRHRTASINEVSARYSVLSKEFYIPRLENITEQSSSNKQGRGEQLDEYDAREVRLVLGDHNENTYGLYEQLLSDDQDKGYGLARETARMVLPTNIYTEWYWKTNLHNLFHFLKLRSDPHAQFEIRCYAQAIADIVRNWVPDSYEAFQDYRQNAVTFSAQEWTVLRDLIPIGLRDKLFEDELGVEYGLSAREAREFIQKLRESAA